MIATTPEFAKIVELTIETDDYSLDIDPTVPSKTLEFTIRVGTPNLATAVHSSPTSTAFGTI